MEFPSGMNLGMATKITKNKATTVHSQFRNERYRRLLNRTQRSTRFLTSRLYENYFRPMSLLQTEAVLITAGKE
jgi:hypothetical protein